MAGIYIHIPFCKQACYYCDFHFSTNQNFRQQMIEAICREATLQQSYLEHEPIHTLYLGGGTPSLLSASELNALFDTIRQNFNLDADAEVTLEANPDDLSPARLTEFRASGINRLSIGIQSFDDHLLQFLNRAHNSQSAKRSLIDAREAGFDNISIDLIYAIPGLTDSLWEETLEQALAFTPEHLSSYSLTIEEKTVFGRWATAGKLTAVHDDTAASQLERLVDRLGKAGLAQYEVSNFSRPGFESRHNSSYWKREKYLGLGPSAHSYNRSSRQFNISNNHLYLKALQTGTVPFTLEVLSKQDQVNDYLLTTLRTSWGANLTILRDEFGYDVMAQHSIYLEDLFSRKLATLANNQLTLTPSGKMLADKISSDLFI